MKRQFKLSRLLAFTAIAGVVGAFTSCADDENEVDEAIYALNLSSLPEVTYPADNPITDEKVHLGKLLFWDPIIGGEDDVACATCHHPDFGYSDGISTPIGVNGVGLGPERVENTGGLVLSRPIDRVGRNSPSIINTAYNGMTSLELYAAENAIMFWDGRARSLEEQCKMPPTSRDEMRGDVTEKEFAMDTVISDLRKIPEYVDLFDEAFGGGIGAVNKENYAKAIASFERTIVSRNSSYDKYLNGQRNALTNQQKEGLLLFYGDAGCGNCHGGPMLSDFTFHVLGALDNPAIGADMGADTLLLFRTPTLRNVAITEPYMHSGVYSTLMDAVEFMSLGESLNPLVLSGMKDVNFKRYDLSLEDKEAIVAFLESLTDDSFDKVPPLSVPSGLPVGGMIL
jgi:cytochrome c peroxidase